MLGTERYSDKNNPEAVINAITSLNKERVKLISEDIDQRTEFALSCLCCEGVKRYY